MAETFQPPTYKQAKKASKPRQGISGKRFLLVVLALVIVAAGVRGFFLIYPVIDSDVGIVGLMGMHLLDGEFSPLFWGQDYGGSQESLVAAPLFWLFGVSRQTLNAAACVISLFYLWAVYLLGRAVYNRRIALVAMAISTVGPFLLIWYSVQAKGINIMVLTMGTWFLWAAARMLKTTPGSGRHLAYAALFGLFAGIGLWAHMLMIYFVVPAGLIVWRHDPKLVVRPRFLVMLLCFFIGSSPLWYYNLTHDWGTFHYMMYPKLTGTFQDSLDWLVWASAPVLSGLSYPGAETWTVPLIAPVIGLLTALALLLALAFWGKSLILRLIGKEGADGSELLLTTLISASLIFCLLGGGASRSHRYLLSVYAVWPVMIAFSLDFLIRRSGAWRKLGWAVLGLFLAFYLAGSLESSLVFNKADREMQANRIEQTRLWTNYFKGLGIKYVYTFEYWDSVRATFDAKKQVVFVLPWQDRYPGFIDQLVRAPRYAYLVRPNQIEELRTSLAALGATYKDEEAPGGFQAFINPTPPPCTPVLLPADHFNATAKPDSLDAAQAWDLNAGTRWSSLAPQKPGQSFTLDLGRATPGVCQILLYSGIFRDVPALLKVEGSLDGQNWQQLVSLPGGSYPWIWADGKPVAPETAPWQELRFAPQNLRYLRLSQAGDKGKYYWSMLEVLVGVAPSTKIPKPDAEAAAAWLSNKLPGKTPIWCGPGLRAWLPKRLWAKTKRQKRPDWMREYNSPWNLMPLKRTLMALPLGREQAARRVLDNCGWITQVLRRHGYSLIIADPPHSPPHSQAVLKGIAPKNGVVDLGKERKVSGLVLSGDAYSLLSPTMLSLEISHDGQNYTPLPFRPVLPPRLYWSGILPLAARPYPLRLEFAPVPARFLRLARVIPPGRGLPGVLRVDVLSPR